MRVAKVDRKTKETNIVADINLDGSGLCEVSTGIGFLDHMLEIFSHHSLINLKLKAVGDTHVDLHHTVEDCAYVLAQGISKAIGDKKGINRYGSFYIPMDESLSRTVIDFSGRPELSPPFSNVSFAVCSALFEASSPCKILVASLASNIFNLLIFFSSLTISSILLGLISVKKFKNFFTSLSSVFLQNCQ